MPLHKTGTKTELTNYRPISLLSSISKILEKLIANRLIKIFNKYNVMYNRQFGFRKNIQLNMPLLILYPNVMKI